MDKIESLCQTVDSLAGLISRLSGDLGKVKSRIEAIEQRQAKLAVEPVPTGDDETADWDTLANMLGMETVAWMVGFVGQISMYGFEDDDRADRNMKAMLIGLAEDECNGCVFRRGDNWEWQTRNRDRGYVENGDDCLNFRPTAAIDMLNAYREDE